MHEQKAQLNSVVMHLGENLGQCDDDFPHFGDNSLLGEMIIWGPCCSNGKNDGPPSEEYGSHEIGQWFSESWGNLWNNDGASKGDDEGGGSLPFLTRKQFRQIL